MKETMKRISARVFVWLPVLLCAAGIFLLSGQDGTQSAALSGETMLPFARVLTALFGEAGHTVFRKFAHFFAYFVLMLLSCNAVYRTRRKQSVSLLTPFAGCVLYAVSDEVHQYFVPERACRLFDIGVDALGCAAAGLCFYLLVRCIRSVKKYLNDRKTREDFQA